MAADPSPRNSAGEIRKYQYIDALRGLAALMVLLVHASAIVPGLSKPTFWFVAYGQMGVQLFFVVSAVTLSLSMAKRRDEPGCVANFYIRRFFRIAPLYYFGIVFYSWWAATESAWTPPLVPIIRGDWAMLTNALFIHGFFPGYCNNVVPGGWSIGTEMSFYVIFPLLFSWQSKIPSKYLFLFVAACALCSYAAEAVYLKTMLVVVDNDSFLYFNIVNQITVFAIGICAYRCLGIAMGQIQVAALFLVFTILALAFWKIGSRLGFSFFLVPIFSAAAFAALTIFASRLRWRGPGFLAAVGKVSYSVYLLHFVILDVVFRGLRLAGFLHLGQPELRLAILYLTAALATYFVSLLTHRLIEQPGIALGQRIISGPAPARSYAEG